MEFTEIREEDDVEALDHGPKAGCLGRIFKGLLIVVGLSLLTLGVLPTILSSDASRKWTLSMVNAEIAPRELTIGQWSFGWFSAPSFAKVHFIDAENGVTFKADSVKLEKGLLQMLPFGKWKVGCMTVMRPDVTITDRKAHV